MNTFSEAFRCHLDSCAQCRERPFDLCRDGEILLRAVGIEAQMELSKHSAESWYPA